MIPDDLPPLGEIPPPEEPLEEYDTYSVNCEPVPDDRERADASSQTDDVANLSNQDRRRVATYPDFWEARDTLKQILAFARARRVGPWAVLAHVLTRIVVSTSPKIVLPPIIGGPASMNVFVGFVADSGGGKTTSAQAARDAVKLGHIETWGLGTGEGIAKRYVHWIKGTKDEPGGLKQHTEKVLFDVSEIGTLASLKARTGATLMPVLRQAYSGEDISFGNADSERALKLDAQTYRMCLRVGIQTKNAGVLLDPKEAAGGTPQRFLWIPTTDPDVPDERTDEPKPIEWVLKDFMFREPTSETRIKVCDTAYQTIDAAHLARQREESEALDGHALLNRLKWAAALGMLEGRLEVTEEDWKLSETLMAVSDATREWCQEALSEEARRSNIARALSDAQRATVSEDKKESSELVKCKERVVSLLQAGPHSKAQLGRKMTMRLRQHLDLALSDLKEQGSVGQSVKYNASNRQMVIYGLGR